MLSPADCPDMPALRAQIDALDTELVQLLARRVGYIDRAVDIKKEAGLPASIPARVEEVIASVRATAVDGGLDPELVEALWRHLIDWSIAREARSIEFS
ncbi:chorismate mutase [Shimia sp.]|uniref:chorismate mutase n=1 Tax=Shimia sp. TaxID=1954381 RepID=UPI0032992189